MQRHLWWQLPLLREQHHAAYFSPIFDMIWVADKPKSIFNGGTADLDSACHNFNLSIDGAHHKEQLGTCTQSATQLP